MGILNFWKKPTKAKFEFPDHLDLDIPMPPELGNELRTESESGSDLPSLSDLEIPPPPGTNSRSGGSAGSFELEHTSSDVNLPPPLELPELTFQRPESFSNVRGQTSRFSNSSPEIPTLEVPSYPVPTSEPAVLKRREEVPLSVEVSKPEVTKSVKKSASPVQFKYVRMDKFEEIEGAVREANSVCKEMSAAYDHLHEIDQHHLSSYDHWHKQLEDCHKKLIFCDATLFGGN